MRRHRFSPGEAGGTLLLVQRIVRDVVREYRRLADRAERYKELRRAGDPTAEQDRERRLLKREMGDLSDEVDGYVTELREIGCEVKDLRSGIVDFPATFEDRPVRLCWRLGEDRVEYWHETTEGCEARRPLTVQAYSR